jgi:signal transduction histidine kinase
MAKTYEESGRVTDGKFIMEQNNILKSYIDNMSDALFIVDRNYNSFPINNSAMDLYISEENQIYKVNEVDKYDNIKFYDENYNTIDNINELISKLFMGEYIKEIYFMLNTKGNINFYNVNCSHIYNKVNEVEKILVSLRDVTDQVIKDRLIKLQKEELNVIIENITDKLIVIDEKGHSKQISRAVKDNPLLDNFEAENIKTFYEKVEHFYIDDNLIPEEDAPQNKLLRGEKFSNYKIKLISLNGTYYYDVSGTPIFDEMGNFIKGILLYHDITDSIRVEENKNIKNQNDIINNFVDNMELKFAKFSYPDYKIIEMNKKAFNLFKNFNPQLKSISNIIGQNYLDYMDITKESIENMISNKINIKLIKYIEELDAYFKIIYQPLYGLNGQVNEIVCFAINITDELKEKEQLEQILKFQDDLIINISHELKTPLNIIYSAVQLMNVYVNNYSENNNEQLKKIKYSIEKNCFRLTKLINNVVDYSKLQEGSFKINLKNENIVEVVENIIESVSEYVKVKQMNIIFDTDIEDKIIACDYDIIERIMLNLISNAIKFTNKGGYIFVNVNDKNDMIEISVKDTGEGIEKEGLNYIFSRFSQEDKSLSRKAEGSGIGLNLVKSLVKLHGGNIRVESKLGEGSNFIIELPTNALPDSKQYLNLKYQDKIEMMEIEFSDIYDND